MKIIPSILTNSQEDMSKKLDFLDNRVDWVQIDVVDGKFANNKTLPLDALERHQGKAMLWEAHLMVKNPFSWINDCSLAMFHRVVAQVEAVDDQSSFIDRVETGRMEAGLALDLPTPVSQINDELFLRLSVVMVMGEKAGFSGQKFSFSSLTKVDELLAVKKRLPANFLIAVDGGVSTDNIEFIKDRGVDIVYLSSSIWNTPDWGQSYRQLVSLAG